MIDSLNRLRTDSNLHNIDLIPPKMFNIIFFLVSLPNNNGHNYINGLKREEDENSFIRRNCILAKMKKSSFGHWIHHDQPHYPCHQSVSVSMVQRIICAMVEENCLANVIIVFTFRFKVEMTQLCSEAGKGGWMEIILVCFKLNQTLAYRCLLVGVSHRQ